MDTNTAPASATSIAPTKPPKKVSKKAAKPAAKKSSAKLVKSSGEGIALKTICSQLKIEPRLARRKLRAAELSFHGKRERWNFTAAQAAKAKEILRA